MATLKEKRAEAMEKLSPYQQKLTSGDMLSDEDTQLVKSLLDEVSRIDEQIATAKKGDDLLAGIAALKSSEPTAARENQGKAKTPGECFVKSLQSQGMTLRQAMKSGMEVEYKAASDIQMVGGSDGAFGPYITQMDTDAVRPYRRPLVIADLFAQGSLTGSALKYPVFGELEGGAQPVREAGAKPQSHFPDPTWVTDSLGEVATWFGVSDDMMDDLPWLQGEITDAAQYSLQLMEEQQLLSGDGADPNLKGLFARGIQELGQDANSDADRLFHCRSLISNKTGFQPDGIVINPTDYEAIRLSKDNNGQYFGGGFFTGQYGQGGIMQDPPLWGLRTVVTEAVAPGTAIVGAFKAGGKILRKGGIQIKSTDSHADYFTSDKQAIRLKERIGLQVKYPKAFVKVTLGKAARTASK